MDVYVISNVTSNEGGYNVGARRTFEEAQRLAIAKAGEELSWKAHGDREWWGKRANGDWMQIDLFEV